VTRITLVVSAHCELCDHARDVLDRLSQELALDVEVLSLDSPRGREVAVASGMAFPPAVLIDGEPFCYGRLSERKLRRDLARRGIAAPHGTLRAKDEG
jgi:hypothetical protein